jgi:hypothetical protein
VRIYGKEISNVEINKLAASFLEELNGFECCDLKAVIDSGLAKGMSIAVTDALTYRIIASWRKSGYISFQEGKWVVQSKPFTL